MREQIRSVFPDDDAEAWRWESESYEVHPIEPPENSFRTWLAETFEGSDEFSQRLVRRMFIIWQELEREGFRANDLELYEHQKALFAWIALSSVTGVRDQIANLLVRSPYGSGKSLTAGLVVRAFGETQEEWIAGGADPKTIPTGALLGLRKEHMLQNALGRQFAVQQPPYTVERADIRVYWKNLGTMFGADFSKHFTRPGGKTHPFFSLFPQAEDDAELPPAAERLQSYLAAMKPVLRSSWEKVPGAKREKILQTLIALMEGKIVFIPDVYNVPQPEKPLPREEEILPKDKRYRGDSAHALAETPEYRVKTTHRHLALDRSAYTTQPNMEHPAQFAVAHGSMLMRDPGNVRADMREEIMKRARFLAIDEAGAYNPATLGDSISQLSGEWPYMVGFTGRDKGIEGWTARSPVLSVRQMIRLKLMKPIGFAGIGDAQNPPEQGTEEAWEAYRKEMFRDEVTAAALGLPQPHELDMVVVAPPGELREYAHRILREHEQRKVPVKVWCFDPQAGDNRWSIVVNGFNAPKKDGDPRRILVAPPSQIAEALHLHAECYDIVANMNRYATDQTRGRLGHVRNTGGTLKEQQKARTYFRVQWLRGAPGEAYIREIAQSMGYVLPEQNATWTPLRCMIDADAHRADGRRKGLSEPRPIPDAQAIRRRKRRRRGALLPGTPLRATSPLVLERERKKAARRADQHLGVHLLSPAYAGNGAVSRQESVKHSPLSRASSFAGEAAPGSFEVRKDGTCITVEIGADGMPTNLAELVNVFDLRGYLGAVAARARDVYLAGKRGEALAREMLGELLRLNAVKQRRSGAVTPQAEEPEPVTEFGDDDD